MPNARTRAKGVIRENPFPGSFRAPSAGGTLPQTVSIERVATNDPRDGILAITVQLAPDQPAKRGTRSDTDALLVPLPPRIDASVAARAVAAAIDEVTTLSRVREALEDAAESVPPGVLTAIAEQEQRWREIETRYGLLDSAQVSDLSRSRAANRAEYASSLHRRRKALAVRRNGRLRFPGFQFDRNGRVYPAIPEIINAMSGESWSPESITLWMDSPNGYLGGRTPIDRIQDVEAVLDAAINAAHAAE